MSKSKTKNENIKYFTLAPDKQFITKDKDPLVLSIMKRNGEHYFESSEVASSLSVRIDKKLLKEKEEGETKKEAKYQVGRDYVISSENKTYLSIEGLTKIIGLSKNKIDYQSFYIWINNTINSGKKLSEPNAKMNTDPDMGLAHDSIKFFYGSTHKVSVIYVYIFALIEELNYENCPFIDLIFEHDGKSYLCKFGFTEDIYRRNGEHLASYGAITGKLYLKFHYDISPELLSDAETDVKKLLNDKKLALGEFIDKKGTKHKELMVIKKEQFDDLSKSLDIIGKKYSEEIATYKRKTLEYKNKCEQLETDLKMLELNKNLELAETKNELNDKHNFECNEINKNHANELIGLANKKSSIISKLKQKLAQMREQYILLSDQRVNQQNTISNLKKELNNTKENNQTLEQELQRIKQYLRNKNANLIKQRKAYDKKKGHCNVFGEENDAQVYLGNDVLFE
jgi:hypothetical protein